ncbi:MAG: hypothetical protein LBU65_10130, partial [Planctomycetaceae bacterium]|nr:hypothetical protein [Planctomycetaceae bacterium]
TKKTFESRIFIFDGLLEVAYNKIAGKVAAIRDYVCNCSEKFNLRGSKTAIFVDNIYLLFFRRLSDCHVYTLFRIIEELK